jgi:hypothetical protein
MKQGSFEVLAQYSEYIRDTYYGFKATGSEDRPFNIPEKKQALDFFHGQDQGKYADFKSSMLNG